MLLRIRASHRERVRRKARADRPGRRYRPAQLHKPGRAQGQLLPVPRPASQVRQEAQSPEPDQLSGQSVVSNLPILPPLRLVVVLPAAALAAAVVFPPALSAQSRVNGLLAYGVPGDCSDRAPADRSCYGSFIETFHPRTGKVRQVSSTELGFDAGDPAWSPNGQFLAFVAGSKLTLTISDADGNDAHEVVRDAVEPAWAPGGRRLIFRRTLYKTPQRAGSGAPTLFVVNSDGSGERRLVRGELPAWSAQSEIAFVRFDRDFDPDVYLMRSDRTGLRRLTRGGQTDRPDWSPDGRRLVVEQRTGRRTNIAIIDRAGRRVRLVTRKGGSTPTWSPDGHKIAFNRGGSIYTVNARGGGLRRIVRYSGRVDGIDWQLR